MLKIKSGVFLLSAFILFVNTLPLCAVPKTAEGTRIAWDYASQRIIAEEGGGYVRVICLQDGTYLAVYESAGRALLRRSYDDGATWTDRQIIVDSYYVNGVRVRAANPEIYQLSDGTLLFGVNYRPTKEAIESWSIAIARSLDGGISWSAPQIIHRAEPRFCDGCWEPSFLEMPDGNVHVYFANEGPYTDSSEQEIACMISRDSGCTWGEYRTVSFRAGHRDGMPVARIFNDEIVVAIEDNAHGEFVPYTVRCSMRDAWKEPVHADSENRNYALIDSLHHTSTYGGAPYLLKLPNGDAAMSYQRSYCSGKWNLDNMEVVVGDKHARNFAHPSYPFDVSNGKTCMWNSICLLDEYTIGAVGSLNVGGFIPVFKKGHLIYGVRAQKNTVNEMPIFIGSKGPTQLRVGVARRAGRLLLKVDVTDADVIAGSDAVVVYVDSASRPQNCLYPGLIRLRVSNDGHADLWKWLDGSWVEVGTAGLAVSSGTKSDGYELNIEIPKSVTGGWNRHGIRLGMTLCESDSVKGEYEEDLVDMIRENPQTWLPVRM